MTLAEILSVYQGSDGDATKAMYARLDALGTAGRLAVNLFRATKTSSRAKVYRGRVPGGGTYRSRSYGTKQWSIDNAARLLPQLQPALTWGWAEDPAQPHHRWVFYVDLPTGQVSFHTEGRGDGPDYSGQWDGIRDAGPTRIARFIEILFRAQETAL